MVYNSLYQQKEHSVVQFHIYSILVVIKDYESAFDAVTLIQIPSMINLSDFQPLSIAKIKMFSSTTGFLLKIFSDKVHAILIEED